MEQDEEQLFHSDYRFHYTDRNTNNTEMWRANSSSTLQIIQSSFIFILNTSLFFVIINCPKLRRKKSHRIILNLLVINDALSIACMISNLHIWTNDHLAINGLLVAMFCNLVLTTFDRYIAIKYPRRYEMLSTTCVVFILICSWIPTVIFVVIVKKKGMTWNEMKVMHIMFISISCIILASSNFMVYYIAKSHDRFLRHNSLQRRRLAPHRFLKASYVCFSVVFSFVLFWMPYCIHDILELTRLYVADNENLFDIIVEQLALLNSLTDPIIFVFLSIPTRNEIRRLINSLKCKETSLDEQITFFLT